MAYQFSELEGQARTLLESRPDDNTYASIAKMVFRAMWSSALTVRRVVKIGEALCAVEEIDEVVMQATLARLCRSGALRSRMHQGRRVYEVNLEG